MRIIFSRKGFDSSSGGCPSPIFPDGSLYSIPIPDITSSIAYSELRHGDVNTAQLVADLTGDSQSGKHFAHLDPDIFAPAYPRQPGWKPLLGQTGSAQGHLRNQQVQVGDLFLFFGLFRPVEKIDQVWRFIKHKPARHILWGWLQIGQILKVDSLAENELPWARYHPHFSGVKDNNNTLYIAADKLILSGSTIIKNQGANIFSVFKDELQLTAPQAKTTGQWRLPGAFYPDNGKPPLSYHSKLDRWQKSSGYCYLKSVSRGQEFVIDTTYFPDTIYWLEQLLMN